MNRERVTGLAARVLKSLNASNERVHYHAAKNAAALKSLADIEKKRGKTDPATIRLCDEYAAEVLGWKGYAPGLYLYSAIAGRFKEGWIPSNYYGAVVVPVTSGTYGDLSLRKTLTGLVLRSPELPDLLLHMHGRFLDRDLAFVPEAEAGERLFSGRDRVIFKLDETRKGSGIHFFDRGSFDIARVRRLGNGVFQSVIRPHETLRRMSPNSVATLRMTSVTEPDGATSVRACYFRVSVGADDHVRAGAAIRIPVDPADGSLDRLGYLSDDATVEAHPDTGIVFDGFRIPNYAACLEAVTRLHARVPFVSCVGWDVTVDEDDAVRLMEWNGVHNAIGFSEAVSGPCFRGLGWEDLWRDTPGTGGLRRP